MATAPTWMDAYNKYDTAHKAKYGGSMSQYYKKWDANPDIKGAKDSIDADYKNALAQYNQANGTNLEPDASFLGYATAMPGVTPGTTPATPGTPTTPAAPTAPSDMDNWRNAISGRFNIGQQSYLEAMPDLAYSIGAAKQIGGLQSRAAMDQYLLSQNLAKRRGQFDNMEDKYAQTAADTNSEANKQRVAGNAAADMASSFANMKDQAERDASRKGVIPGSGRALAMGNQMAIAQAGASAGAQNKAMNDLDVLADSRQRTAIGFGSGLIGQSMNAAGAASNMGNAALASANSPLTNRLNFAGGLSNLYGNAASDYANMWQSQNLTAAQQANINAQNDAASAAENNAFLGVLGSIAGGWASSGFAW